MKITKKELMRTIKEEIIKEETKNKKTKVNKKTKTAGPYTVQPVKYPTSTGKTDAADNIEELYRSVYGISNSVMQMSDRIDGIEKVVEELKGDIKFVGRVAKKAFDQYRTFDSRVDPDDPYIEGMMGQIEMLYEIIESMLDALPEEVEAQMDAQMKAKEEEEGEE